MGSGVPVERFWQGARIIKMLSSQDPKFNYTPKDPFPYKVVFSGSRDSISFILSFRGHHSTSYQGPEAPTEIEKPLVPGWLNFFLSVVMQRVAAGPQHSPLRPQVDYKPERTSQGTPGIKVRKLDSLGCSLGPHKSGLAEQSHNDLSWLIL